MVTAEPTSHVGTRVRWGGHIVDVKNGLTATDVELVGRRLDNSGRPKHEDESAGRFIARYPGFLDPAIYEPERELTVAGPLTEPEQGKVGEHPYLFPVVAVESHYLWPKREPVAPYAYPYPPYPYYPYYPYYGWRGPYYDPWWW